MSFNSYTSGTENLYKLTGNEEQKEWDVFDFNARIYDPVLGRFNSIDPLTELQDSWNPYHYNYNNPIAFVDPAGLMPNDFNIDNSYEFDDSYERIPHIPLFEDPNPCKCTGNPLSSRNKKTRLFGNAFYNDAARKNLEDPWANPILTVGTIGGRILESTWDFFQDLTEDEVPFSPGPLKIIKASQGALRLAEFKKLLPNSFKGIDKIHLDAAIGDMAGNPIIKWGKVWDHLDDITSHMRSLNGKLKELDDIIYRGNLSDDLLEEANQLRSALQNQYDYYYGALQRAANKYSKEINVKKKGK